MVLLFVAVLEWSGKTYMELKVLALVLLQYSENIDI